MGRRSVGGMVGIRWVCGYEEGQDMSEVSSELRPATPDEIRAERSANPADYWVQTKLGLDEGLVARAARRLWGPPVRSFAEGERLWRLWDPEHAVPVYLAIGLLPPAALFPGGMLPEEDVRQAIGAELRRMLVAAGGAVPTLPLTPPPTTPC